MGLVGWDDGQWLGLKPSVGFPSASALGAQKCARRQRWRSRPWQYPGRHRRRCPRGRLPPRPVHRRGADASQQRPPLRGRRPARQSVPAVSAPCAHSSPRIHSCPHCRRRHGLKPPERQRPNHRRQRVQPPRHHLGRSHRLRRPTHSAPVTSHPQLRQYRFAVHLQRPAHLPTSAPVPVNPQKPSHRTARRAASGAARRAYRRHRRHLGHPALDSHPCPYNSSSAPSFRIQPLSRSARSGACAARSRSLSLSSGTAGIASLRPFLRRLPQTPRSAIVLLLDGLRTPYKSASRQPPGS